MRSTKQVKHTLEVELRSIRTRRAWLIAQGEASFWAPESVRLNFASSIKREAEPEI
jgi:hypothetical protein